MMIEGQSLRSIFEEVTFVLKLPILKENITETEYKQKSFVDSSKFDDNDLKMVEFFHDYAKENLAKIAIYLRDPYHISYIKDVKIQLTDFCGNIGGLLGLCLGFSIISFFELLFHCLFQY